MATSTASSSESKSLPSNNAFNNNDTAETMSFARVAATTTSVPFRVMLDSLILTEFTFKFSQILRYVIAVCASLALMLYLFPAHLMLMILFIVLAASLVLLTLMQKRLAIQNRSIDVNKLQSLRLQNENKCI